MDSNDVTDDVQKLVDIIDAVVFKLDKQEHEPGSILWVQYQEIVKSLKKNGVQVSTKR